uniref:Putative proline glutamate and leucine rich protein 1 n=1 Tax=Rhipicephalus pulchellus TaxID=72859 RepID=L7LW93_RHIPC
MFTVLERSFDSKQSPKSKLNFLEASQANTDYFGQADFTPKVVATKVKSLLQSQKTSYDALLLLDCYLSTFPVGIVQADALFWTRSIIHLLAGKRPRGAQRAGWRLLCRLLPLLSEQMNRDAAGLMPVLLERLLAHLSSPLEREPDEGALRCLLVCMKEYGRLMSSVQDALEKTLLRLLVTWNSQLVQELVCECVALLPCCRRAGGGGNKGAAASEAWSQQLGRLMATVHTALDSLFQDLHIDKGRPRADKAVPLEVPSSPEESHQASLLCWRRTMSLMRTISLMLVGSSMHQPVLVPFEDVLELVYRVLGAHLPVKSSGATAQANLVAAILPSIQHEAVQLLSQLICSCRQLLMPEAANIIGLIEEVCLRTTQDLSNDTRRLRQACYAALSLWLQTIRSRLGLSSLVEKLVPHLLQDIEPVGATTVQLASSRNGGTTPHKDRNKVDDSFNLESCAQLCENALKALQSLVSAPGAIMKPETVQEIQCSVVTLLLRLQQPGNPLPQPYRSPRCRRALYALLLSLAASRNGPPPLHCCARLFNVGLKDTCYEVVELCSQALSCLSLHPQGSGPTGTWPPLRCHRAAWVLADGACQTTPPTLASVGCQAQLQPPPSPRAPAVAVPQPIKRKAATMHFRAKRITTLGPIYRTSHQEAEVLSDEDGHEYMDYEEDYEDAELEKLQAAEAMQMRRPPVNGQGFHERHLGSAVGPGTGGRSAGGATGPARLAPVTEDSSEDEEGSEEDYDEDEEEGDYGESAEEPCIEAIELESDDVDGSGLPLPESDGAPEEAALTVLEASHEEDQEEVGVESDAAFSITADVTEASVTVTPASSQPSIVVEDGLAEEEEVPPQPEPQPQPQPEPCETEEAGAEVVQEPCTVTAEPEASKVDVEEPVLVENHTEEEKGDDSKQEACEGTVLPPPSEPCIEPTVTKPMSEEPNKIAAEATEEGPGVTEMLRDFVDCGPDE